MTAGEGAHRLHCAKWLNSAGATGSGQETGARKGGDRLNNSR